MKNISFEDGIIQLQPKSDMMGRFASSGGHSNYGYSGYFKTYVYLNGKRKTLVEFWSLFPGDGHHYGAQQDKAEVENRIRAVIESRAGTDIVKVARGYAFDPTHTPSDRLPKKHDDPLKFGVVLHCVAMAHAYDSKLGPDADVTSLAFSHRASRNRTRSRQ